MSQLKPGETTQREFRHTIKDAAKAIPTVEKPNEVKEVIFQVGLNDFRKGYTAKEIQENMLDLQLQYKEHFPNARQHITAIPPLANGHKEVNRQLQKLSRHTQTNFISTKPFLDHTTGKLRPNLTNGIHYTEWGIRILAREIKKSLYSSANIENDHLNTIKNHLKEAKNPQPKQTPVPTAAAIVTTASNPVPVPTAKPIQPTIPEIHIHESQEEYTEIQTEIRGPHTEPTQEIHFEHEWQSWLL